jgi:SAM-dependent methyltransferase
LGVSDRPYFDWLTGAIDRFERAQGRLAALGRERPEVRLWGLAEQRETPALKRLRAAIGGGATVTLFDKFATDDGVRAVDLNALDALPGAACDVVTVLRSSYFAAEPAEFLRGLRRILRPGGLALVDWLHGCSDAPVLDFPLDQRCGGGSSPVVTTYMDATFLAEFPREFDGFMKDVNSPPWGVNVERPGEPVGVAARLRRLADRAPRRALSRATYAETLRADLARAGKRLIEPGLLERHFEVLFRDARYLRRETGKFNLYLLTVLRPVHGAGNAP